MTGPTVLVPAPIGNLRQEQKELRRRGVLLMQYLLPIASEYEQRRSTALVGGEKTQTHVVGDRQSITPLTCQRSTSNSTSSKGVLSDAQHTN